MKHHKSANTRVYREPTLPGNLTDLVIERIRNLRPSVKTDYLKETFLSKFVSRDTDPASLRASRAEAKWLYQEHVNEVTEHRLLITDGEYNILPRVTYSRFIEVCAGLIVGVIGDTPPIEATIGSFSGGASTSRPRTQSQPALKYVGIAHVTEEAMHPFSFALSEMQAWFPSAQALCGFNPYYVPGNVMFTVPKKTDIDRVAAKEPDLNMFVQKGIGNYIRRNLLKAAGINLNDQSKNRSFALRGSIDGSLATLDLSSASDSVTTELVFQLLPVTWFTLLDSVRSRVTRLLGGEEHRNCMFSSMGNGFTFELESLIFWALMKATAILTGTRGVVSVYGDDLIIPTEMVSEAMHVLSYMGFTVNPEKSSYEGPFRESCGGHYWNGLDITPFYIKEPIETTTDLIHVANQLRKWGEQRLNGELLSPILDPEVEEMWLWLKSYVPKCLWGGVDTSFKYQLVSRDTPQKRLQEVTDKVGAGNGGYTHWLNATWQRSVVSDWTDCLMDHMDLDPDLRAQLRLAPLDWASDSVQTSEFSRQRNQLRLRTVRERTVPRLETLFLHEVEGMITVNNTV